MKDSEFIELLNLYLDHEITATDAARLEAAVQDSPERRRVYQQYCRMQKACTLLAKDFKEPAPLDAAGETRKIVAFEQTRRPSWGAGIYATGGLLAAAACVALVLVNRTTKPDFTPVPTPATVAALVPAASSASQVDTTVIVAQSERVADHTAMARTVTMPAARRSDFQAVSATRGFVLSNPATGAEQSTAVTLPAQLDWLSSLRIAPMQLVQAEDLRFEARPVQAPKDATYGSRTRLTQPGVFEMTAFQFQK